MQSTISPEIWFKHIDAWKQTGISQAEYCRKHNLRPNQFWYWKAKLQGRSGNTSIQSVTSGFAVAQFETFTTEPNQGLSVTLPDGTKVNDINAVNIHLAAQLLEALR